MRLLAIGLAVIGFLYAPQAAQARYHKEAYTRHHLHHFHHRYSRYLSYRHWRYTHRGVAPCHGRAASMGGPCGCEAAWRIMRVADHVWHGYNLWLAWDWSRFPRAEPGPGTAAVWKNRSHVAAVAHDNHDGTVTVDDYWAVHRVSLSQVLIVDPRPKVRRTYRVSEAWPL
jgi:hypothetical protein